MNKSINTGEILKGLTDVLEFIKKDFGYEYYSPDKKNDESVSIKPDTAFCSLLGSHNEVIKILNGGVVSIQQSTEASLKSTLHTYGNLVSIYPIVIPDDVSVFSSDSILRTVKEVLLMESEDYCDKHISSKKIDNHKNYLSPKDPVTYIEDYPDVRNISKKLTKMLTKLTDDLYNKDEVYHVSLDIYKTLNFEIFVDNDSKIVQYRYITRVNTEVSFINLNNQLIPINITEYLEGTDYKRFAKNLRRKIFSYINKFSEFHDLASGVYPVKLKPSASNVLLHEGIGAHVLSGNYICSGESTIFKDRLNELIPSLKGVDLIMNPKIKNGFGSYKYDQEGCKAEKVYLIKDGVITNYLTDRSSASGLEQMDKDRKLVKKLTKIVDKDDSLIKKYVNKRFLKNRKFKNLEDQISFLLSRYALNDLIKNVNIDHSLDWRSDYTRLTNKSNGHSRVQSWLDVDDNGEAYMVSSEARMSNLIIDTKNKNKISVDDKMLKLCKKSDLDFYLEVEAFEGEVDVETGMFRIDPEYVTKVYLDGRKENINCGSFSMSLENILKNIAYVGSNNEVNKGFCGADSGFVPVQSDTPEMIVWNMPYVGGTSMEVATDEEIAVLQNKI